MIFNNKKEKLYKNASKIALGNSQNIYNEAKLLIDEEYYARGFALCVISLEESAKSFLYRLISLDLVYEDKTLQFVRRGYDAHKNKLQQSSLILSFSTKFLGVIIEFAKMAHEEGHIKEKFPLPNDYKERLEELVKLSERIAKFQSRKNDSLYVDVREGKIIDPNNMVKKEQALTMLEIVNMQTGIVKPFIYLDNAKFLAMWKEPLMSQLKIKELLKP